MTREQKLNKAEELFENYRKMQQLTLKHCVNELFDEYDVFEQIGIVTDVVLGQIMELLGYGKNSEKAEGKELDNIRDVLIGSIVHGFDDIEVKFEDIVKVVEEANNIRKFKNEYTIDLDKFVINKKAINDFEKAMGVIGITLTPYKLRDKMEAYR